MRRPLMLLAALAGCGGGDPPPAPEPVGLVVDLRADAATMREMAAALEASSGVPFRLAPGTDPDRTMADPYQVFLPKQDLKEHLVWLEKEMGLWGFRWTGGAYEVRVLDPGFLYR